MARRSVLCEYIDDLPDIRILPGEGRYDYVSVTAGGPLRLLVWTEVVEVLRKARLTALEAAVVDAYMRGYVDAQIADGLNRLYQLEDHYNRNAIKAMRRRAFEKIRKCPHIGVLTAMYEEFPVSWVNAYADSAPTES